MLLRTFLESTLAIKVCTLHVLSKTEMWAKTYLQKLTIDLYGEKLILRNNLNIQQMENS